MTGAYRSLASRPLTGRAPALYTLGVLVTPAEFAARMQAPGVHVLALVASPADTYLDTLKAYAASHPSHDVAAVLAYSYAQYVGKTMDEALPVTGVVVDGVVRAGYEGRRFTLAELESHVSRRIYGLGDAIEDEFVDGFFAPELVAGVALTLGLIGVGTYGGYALAKRMGLNPTVAGAVGGALGFALVTQPWRKT